MRPIEAPSAVHTLTVTIRTAWMAAERGYRSFLRHRDDCHQGTAPPWPEGQEAVKAAQRMVVEHADAVIGEDAQVRPSNSLKPQVVTGRQTGSAG